MSLQALFRSFRSLWGLATAAVLAGPLSVWAGGIDPPEPAGLAVVIATPFCIIVLLLCWLWVPQLSDALKKWIATALLTGSLVALVWYLSSYFEYVIHVSILASEEPRTVRLVIGSTLRQDMGANGRDTMELLENYAFDPKRVWTESSVLHNQVRLHLLFTAGFALLTAGFGILAADKRVTQNRGKQH